MSYLSNALRSLMEDYREDGLTQKELALRTQFDEGTVSRLAKGRQVFIKPEDLNRLAQGLASFGLGLPEQCKVIVGHLHDEIPDAYRDHVRVEYSGAGQAVEEAPAGFGEGGIWPVMERLGRKAVHDADLRQMLEYWDKVLSGQDSQARPKDKKRRVRKLRHETRPESGNPAESEPEEEAL